MKNKLTLDALEIAYWRRKPLKGLEGHILPLPVNEELLRSQAESRSVVVDGRK